MDDELVAVLSWLQALDLQSVPEVERKARWLVADTLGCVMAGRRAASVAQFEARSSAADPGAFRFSGGPGLSATHAAMVLAMAACWDEACEGHAGAHGRPGVAALAALLPLSSALSYGAFLKSFVVGYEVGARFGASLRIKKGMHVDGNWPSLGAAAAVAHALGLGPRQIAQAVQIAACQLPMSLYLPVRSGDTSRNTYLGHSAVLGQNAALAAASGVTAPATAAHEYAMVGLGQGPADFDRSTHFHIGDAYFKPYAAVRHVHYGALAAHRLGRHVDLHQVASLVLEIYEEAIIYCGNRHPQTPLQAQFSLSFGVAAMLRWGRLDPWVYREPQFQDPLLRQLEGKVSLQVDAAWTQRQQRGARLSMIFKDGPRLEQAVPAVPGDAQMPFTLQALSDKFFVYCDGSLSVDEAARVLDHCLNAPPQAKPFSFWNYPQEITPC